MLWVFTDMLYHTFHAFIHKDLFAFLFSIYLITPPIFFMLFSRCCARDKMLNNTKVIEWTVTGQYSLCLPVNNWVKNKWSIFSFCGAPQLPWGSPVLILGMAHVCACVWSCGQACVQPVSQAKHLSRVYVWDYGVTAISNVRALQPKALSLISPVVWIKAHGGGPTRLGEVTKRCLLGMSQFPV